METRKKKNIFTEGPVEAAFIADSIAKHATNTSIGGHSIFLGQVRADQMDGKQVEAIEYTSHMDMALEVMATIREDIFARYALTCMHVHHSLGVVKKGEICLFVFVSSKHRKDVQLAIEFIVEEIKKKVPIFGKELFEDDSFVWKENN